jgi:hypothetical protein
LVTGPQSADSLFENLVGLTLAVADSQKAQALPSLPSLPLERARETAQSTAMNKLSYVERESFPPKNMKREALGGTVNADRAQLLWSRLSQCTPCISCITKDRSFLL